MSVQGSATVSVTPNVGKVRGCRRPALNPPPLPAHRRPPALSTAWHLLPQQQVYLSVSVNKDNVKEACDIASQTTREVTAAVKAASNDDTEASRRGWREWAAVLPRWAGLGLSRCDGQEGSHSGGGQSGGGGCSWDPHPPCSSQPLLPPPLPQVSTSNLSIQQNITYGIDGQQQVNGYICQVRVLACWPVGCWPACCWVLGRLAPGRRFDGVSS